MWDVVGEDERPEAVQMLQTRSSARQPLSWPSPELQEVLPIAWVHFPKCGTSFFNTIAHSPGVCPFLPEDARLTSNTSEFRTTYLTSSIACPGLATHNFNHPALGTASQPPYEQGKGHYMAMVRQPEQRILSVYSDMRRCSPDTPGKCKIDIRANKETSWGGWDSLELPNVTTFAKRQAGCMVRMLTRPGFPCGGLSDLAVSPEEVAEARRRLREGFSFVGITDYWDLSICLYSAMFKVGCRRIQFQDVRPGPDKWNNSWTDVPREMDADDERRLNSTPLDESVLNGFTDIFDGELYAEALDIFEGRLKRYNVTKASCEPCWRDAGVLVDTSSVQKLLALGRSVQLVLGGA
uniref:Sulfotransferase domain-containing protein n=1 Tax=Alexandrium catenella TaxID=2925 RepID=A0A7S1W936_ALECA|mmetsp:Transcript_44/g.115  ORF Transcript_44/g.115 Transcript_44/m.115 type:complete len:351 (+) Transcript_44:1-1053(+)